MTEKSLSSGTEQSYLSIFDKIYEKIPIYSLIFDSKGSILRVNNKLNEVLLYKKKKILSSKISEIILLEDTSKNTLVNYIVKKLGSDKELTQFTFKGKNSVKIPVEGFISNLKMSNSFNYLLIAYNIDERIKLFNKVKELKNKLDKTLSKYPELKLWSITQKKEPMELIDKSIKELKKTQKNYKEILENINEGYFELDLQGNVSFINEGFSKILGYSKSQVFGKNFRNIFELDEIQKLEKILKNDLTDDTYEFKVKGKKGQKITIETSLVPKKEENEIIGYFGILRDISSRKRVERLEKQFRKELEEKVEHRTKELQEALNSQKCLMDEIIKTSRFKSEFLGNFSHELRTPLNVIIGFTELLLEMSEDVIGALQREYLNDIKDAAEHLLDLIEKLLDISSIESRKIKIRREEINFKEFLVNLKSSFYPQLRNKDIDFNIINYSSNPTIYSDPIRLKQILLNILSNAFKFTFNGKIELIIKEDPAEWEFIIEDTGIGIKKEDFHLVFKEFKRIQSDQVKSIHGSGLGLPLTKRLVSLLGGKISFSSQIGKGSEFHVILPKKIY
ncbi:MAG: PAS domain S-box protein [Candidatus Lokiarchaeota archaeon]|nr:PAS domain S-box protein [Candidatus Lokiarchaeota archaeon]MBD3198560.1 PAS domain S-box protein [Candidatus Lokiarchaeota archaeon]